MIWEGKPRTSGKKGSWAQGNRKSRVLGGETADQLGKRDRGLRQPEVTCFGMGKPLRNAGSKSKVQFKHRGWSLDSKKTTPCWKTKKDLFHVTSDHVVIHFNGKSVPFLMNVPF